MTHDFLLSLIQTALAEDIGSGDITSALMIPDDAVMTAHFVAREELVVCGAEVPELVYAQFTNHEPQITTHVSDGHIAKPGDIIATVSGHARTILTGERTALNIMQRMSGVATLTKKYVDAVSHTKAKILDTRKTMPGMRMMDKYAVTCGGGVNHRMGLYDAVMVKDNHLGVRHEGLGMGERIKKIESQLTSLIPHPSSPVPIYVECDTLEQLREILPTKPDRILLDNMSLEMLREAVAIVKGAVPLEATGGVNLSTIRAIAETGVDYISVGAITHSAPNVDIGLDITA